MADGERLGEGLLARGPCGLAREFADDLLDNIGEAIAIIDRNYRLIDLNHVALAIDRRPRDDLIGQSIWTLAAGLDASPLGSALRDAMNGRRPLSVEHEQTWPDGRTEVVEARVVPISAGAAIFYREIGERRRADDALRASEELNRRILQSSTDCIKVLTLDGRLELMSEGGQMVMEVDDLHPLIGKAWEGFWPEAERQKIRHAVAEAAEGRAGRFFGQAPTAKGNLRWWDVAVSPIAGADGNPERLLSISRDVTAARLAEAKLAETTRRLDAILANTTMAVFLMDERQHCIYANAAAEALTGYSFAQMQGKPLHDVVHHTRPDGSAYPLSDCPIDRAFPERAQVCGEELFVAPDGSFYPVAFTASPVLNEDGLPIGTVIEARNISAEKARDAALQETSERYRLAARATRDAIWDWDLATHHVHWNEALSETFGYAETEVEQNADWWVAHIHPDDRDRVTQGIHAVIDGTGRIWSDEYRFLKADGAVTHVLDRGYVIRDAAGKATRMIGAMLDLTEQRRNEALLRESHDRFRAAVEAVQGILWTNDAAGRMVGEQPGWSALTGQTQAEYEGYGWATAVHPDDAQPTIEAWEAAVAERRMFVFEHRLRRHDGAWRLFSIRAVPAFDAHEDIREWVGVHTDITDQRAAEDALRHLNETLEQRVEAAVKERELAQDALRQAQKMEAVGQLTGGIAHDFNNMLAIVTGSLDLASRRLERGQDGAQRYLEHAREGADRAAALTQRLLAFSRQQPLAPRVVSLNRLVADISELLRRTLGETVALETVQAGGLWNTHVDPNQLESALVNLAVNARDAMPGGGRLTIETANAYLDELYVRDQVGLDAGQYVVVAVSDSGTGMAPDVAKRVFDPFFTTKPVGKGTGLGLSMVYGFVKQSGGHVAAYSELGQGTTFKIYLPRHSGDVADATLDLHRAPAPRAAGAEVVLVVEDDERVRRMSVEALRELGYIVHEADSGERALEMAPGLLRLDLLFTDVVMPGMTGRKLAERIHQLRPEVRVLYTTGYTRNAVVHNGVLDADVEFIAKPFTVTGLGVKVREVLDA